MIKVLVVSPYGKDANSYYRCFGPWNYLRRQNPGKVCITPSDGTGYLGISGIAWEGVDQHDLIFMHRPCRPDDVTLMRVAKNVGVPVWVDFDDWLFDVPYWNPTKGIYDNPGIQNAIATCMACADVVSVSTAALYDKVKLVNKNVVILPNMYRSDLYRYREQTPSARKSEFCWRGTNTHDADMMSVGDGFKKLKGKITFYGSPYWGILQGLDPENYQIRVAQDHFMYMRQLHADAPKVMVIPLVDNLFNRVKSNIAYQEALHAGALCVAPDLPEWKRVGVITYEPGNADSFAEAANAAFALSPEAHAEAVFQGWSEMLKQYDAPVVSALREEVIKSLLSKDFDRNDRDPFDQLVGFWALGSLKGKRLIPHGTSNETLKKAGIA